MVVSTDVTRRAIVLGANNARNATTGWRSISYSTSTKEVIILPASQAVLELPPGYHATYTYVGFTQDSFVVGDQILDANSQYFLVEKNAPCYVGDVLDHYILELSLLTEWQAATGSTTWSLVRLEDPRHLLKEYIDGYARVAQITKDNDSDQAVWASMFNNPPYPMHLEFRHATSPVQGLYVLGRTQSKGLIDHDMQAYGYHDDCLVDICTMDSTGCSGWALAWKMEHEFRYVLENNPFGSLREYDSAEAKQVDIGSMCMYDLPVKMSYERKKTV